MHIGYKTSLDLWNKQENTIYYKNNYLTMEHQANEFADALIMPKRAYKEIMDQCTIGNKVETAKIANYFGVSISAASNREKRLGCLQSNM